MILNLVSFTATLPRHAPPKSPCMDEFFFVDLLRILSLPSRTPVRPFLLFGLICLALGAHAQQRAAEPVFLDYADSLRSAEIESQTVRYFLGHVKFLQGNVVITCEKAVHNVATNVAEMTGGVRIVQDTLIITAPQAVYNANTKLATASGGVKLTDRVVTLTAAGGTYNVDTRIAVFHGGVKIVNDTGTITANDLTYNRDTEISIATGAVTIIDSSAVITCARLTNDRITQQSSCAGGVRVLGRQDRSRIFGDSIFHDAKRNVSFIPRNPMLVHVDSTRADSTHEWAYDTTFIVARTMEAIRGEHETFMAHDSVRMVRGDMQAKCGEGTFARWRDLITLGRGPVVWYNQTQLTGDSITIILRNNKMERLVVENAAFALTQRDSLHPRRFDQLAGGKLFMFFRDDSLRTIRVEKNALSVYFGFEEHRARGANRASGDTISISLAGGKPDMVYTLGGGEGQYFPEKLVRKSELDFRLPGFDNREAERPKRSEFSIPQGQ